MNQEMRQYVYRLAQVIINIPLRMNQGMRQYAYRLAQVIINTPQFQWIAATRGFKMTEEAVVFVWKNKPNFKESILYSFIQSFIGIYFDIERYFGSNPTARSIIRDVAKAPAEIPLAFRHDNWGETEFWHDSMSLIGAWQKPVVKGLSIYGYRDLFFNRMILSIREFEKLIQSMSTSEHGAIKIPDNINTILIEHLAKDLIDNGGRFSNLIGEPLARMLDGCAKKYQKNLATIHGNIANDIALKKMHSLEFRNALFYIMKNGPDQIPYAGANSFLKTAGLDYLGKLYGKHGPAEQFKKTRQFIDGLILWHLEGLSGVETLSFYERRDAIWAAKIGDNSLRKYFSTIATFTSELVENTLHNMLIMYLLSTPNKALGNLLFELDALAGWYFRSAGLALGGRYAYTEFFASTPSKAEKLSEPKNATQQDKCWSSFFTKVLADHDNTIPSTYSDEKTLTVLFTCLGFNGSVNINQTIPATPPLAAPSPMIPQSDLSYSQAVMDRLFGSGVKLGTTFAGVFAIAYCMKLPQPAQSVCIVTMPVLVSALNAHESVETAIVNALSTLADTAKEAMTAAKALIYMPSSDQQPVDNPEIVVAGGVESGHIGDHTDL